MSGTQRAYNLLRGYVQREWDRIQGTPDAWEELDRPDTPPSRSEANSGEPSRIEIAGETVYGDPKLRASEILGVPITASYTEIRKSFNRLHDRTRPDKFPADSELAKQAKIINDKVNWAYAILSEGANPTERRFNNLEID